VARARQFGANVRGYGGPPPGLGNVFDVAAAAIAGRVDLPFNVAVDVARPIAERSPFAMMRAMELVEAVLAASALPRVALAYPSAPNEREDSGDDHHFATSACATGGSAAAAPVFAGSASSAVARRGVVGGRGVEVQPRGIHRSGGVFGQACVV
jgi:hypothetical protein